MDKQENISNYRPNILRQPYLSKANQSISSQSDTKSKQQEDIGNKGSGKTSFIYKLVNSTFSFPQGQTEFHNVVAKFMSTRMLLKVYEIGNSQIKEIKTRVNADSNWCKVALIFYNVAEPHSYNSVESYIKEWREAVGKKSSNNAILVANHADIRIKSRRIAKQEGLALAQKYGIVFVENSNLYDDPIENVLSIAIMNKICKLGVNKQKVRDFISEKSKEVIAIIEKNKKFSHLLYTKANQIAVQWSRKVRNFISKLESQMIPYNNLIVVFIQDIGEEFINFLKSEEEYRKYKAHYENIQAIKKLLVEEQNKKQQQMAQDQEEDISNNKVPDPNKQRLRKILELEESIGEKKDTLYQKLKEQRSFLKEIIANKQQKLLYGTGKLKIQEALKELSTWVEAEELMHRQIVEVAEKEQLEILQQEQKAIQATKNEVKSLQELLSISLQIESAVNKIVDVLTDELDIVQIIEPIKELNLAQLTKNLIQFYIDQNKEKLKINQPYENKHLFTKQKLDRIFMSFKQQCDQLTGKWKDIINNSKSLRELQIIPTQEIDVKIKEYLIKVMNNWLIELKEKEQKGGFLAKLFG